MYYLDAVLRMIRHIQLFLCTFLFDLFFFILKLIKSKI